MQQTKAANWLHKCISNSLSQNAAATACCCRCCSCNCTDSGGDNASRQPPAATRCSCSSQQCANIQYCNCSHKSCPVAVKSSRRPGNMLLLPSVVAVRIKLMIAAGLRFCMFQCRHILTARCVRQITATAMLPVACCWRAWQQHA